MLWKKHAEGQPACQPPASPLLNQMVSGYELSQCYVVFSIECGRQS